MKTEQEVFCIRLQTEVPSIGALHQYVKEPNGFVNIPVGYPSQVLSTNVLYGLICAKKDTKPQYNKIQMYLKMMSWCNLSVWQSRGRNWVKHSGNHCIHTKLYTLDWWQSVSLNFFYISQRKYTCWPYARVIFLDLIISLMSHKKKGLTIDDVRIR